MKKNNSYFRSALWIGVFLAGAFLVLPAIFPEDAAVADKKLSAEAAAQGSADAALPVVFSENPLSKFFKKLSKFYGLGKKTPTAANAAGDVVYSDERAVFPLEASAADSPSVSFGQADSSAAPSAFYAADGTEIKADENGYYYGQDYYKNGAYPSEELKKSIESAIARYHTAAAAAANRKPVYVQSEDGALQVQYVSDEDYSRYMSGAKMGEDGSPQNHFLGSSDRYVGATVASKEGSYNSSSKSGDGYSKQDLGSFAAANSIEGQLLGLNARIDRSKKDTAQENKIAEEKAKEDYEKNKLQLISSADKFMNYRYVEPSQGTRSVPVYNRSIFKDKRLIADSGFLRVLSEKFDIQRQDFNQEMLKDASFLGRGAKDKNALKIIEQNIEGADVFKVLAWQKTDALHSSIHALKKQYGDDKFYFDHVGVPVNIPNKKFEERKTFTDTFFNDTGLKYVLEAGDVKKEKIDEIEAKYQKLDERRAAFTATLKEIVARDPNIRSLKTTTTFFLGKDENDNLVVATPKSFLYAYSSPAPEWIAGKLKGDNDRAYVAVPVDEFVSHLKDNGNVTVVTTERAENKIKDLGANTVANIDNSDLSSFDPDSIKRNMEVMSGKIMQEANRVAQSSQKESLDRAKALLENTKKTLAKEKPKGVNATGKTPAKTATVSKGPLRNEYLGQKPQTSYIDLFRYKGSGFNPKNTFSIYMPPQNKGVKKSASATKK